MSDIYVTKKKGESFEALFRRFTKRLQQSGKLLNAKANRFFSREESKTKRHKSAIRRLEKKAIFEYELKTGKIKEEDLRTARR